MPISAERPTLDEFQFKKEAESGKDYYEKINVNGTEISVGWDTGYDNFTIYFPQIEVGAKQGVEDQAIIIADQAETAKQVFDYAVQLAEKETDIYEIYKKVRAFVKKVSTH